MVICNQMCEVGFWAWAKLEKCNSSKEIRPIGSLTPNVHYVRPDANILFCWQHWLCRLLLQWCSYGPSWLPSCLTRLAVLGLGAGLLLSSLCLSSSATALPSLRARVASATARLALLCAVSFRFHALCATCSARSAVLWAVSATAWLSMAALCANDNALVANDNALVAVALRAWNDICNALVGASSINQDGIMAGIGVWNGKMKGQYQGMVNLSKTKSAYKTMYTKQESWYDRPSPKTLYETIQKRTVQMPHQSNNSITYTQHQRIDTGRIYTYVRRAKNRVHSPNTIV